MKTLNTLKITGNRDTGSVLIPTSELPQEFRTNALRPPNGALAVKVVGVDAAPRLVTYIMGSEAKGFHLTAKGAGQFPTGDFECEVLVAE